MVAPMTCDLSVGMRLRPSRKPINTARPISTGRYAVMLVLVPATVPTHFDWSMATAAATIITSTATSALQPSSGVVRSPRRRALREGFA